MNARMKPNAMKWQENERILFMNVTIAFHCKCFVNYWYSILKWHHWNELLLNRFDYWFYWLLAELLAHPKMFYSPPQGSWRRKAHISCTVWIWNHFMYSWELFPLRFWYVIIYWRIWCNIWVLSCICLRDVVNDWVPARAGQAARRTLWFALGGGGAVTIGIRA